MADLVYKGTPWGDITILDSWPEWQRQQWLKTLKGYTPEGAAFTPKFRTAVLSRGAEAWVINSSYFPEMETAQWISSKYGDGAPPVEFDFDGTFAGFFQCNQKEYRIRLRDGRMVNAGFIAAYYTRNPEDQFPGVADKAIRAVLGIRVFGEFKGQ